MIPFAPTARGKVVVIMTIAAVAVGLVNVNLLTCAISSCFCALVFSSLILSFLSLNGLSLQRGACSDGFAGEKLSMPIHVVNRRRYFRQDFVISESLPFSCEGKYNIAVSGLMPGENRTVRRAVPALKRGFFKLEKIFLVGGDPAGLFRRVKTFRIPEELTIFPEIVKLSWMPVTMKHRIQASTNSRPIGVTGQGQEFFGVREYRHSDGVRFICWKASARQKRIMVREFESNTVMKICILLDVEKKYEGRHKLNSNFEYLVKTASSISSYLSNMFCEVMLVSCDKTGDISVIKGMGSGTRNLMMNHLASVETGELKIEKLLTGSTSEIPDNSILYCLTMSSPETLFPLFDGLLDRNIEIRWILAPPENFPQEGLPAKQSNPGMENKDFYGVEPLKVDFRTELTTVLSYG